MKKFNVKKYLPDFGSYFLIYEASLLIGFLVYLIALYPFKIIFSPTEVVERLVCFLLCSLGTAAGLFVLSFPKGYKRSAFQWKSIFFALLFVLAVQQIIAPLFQYMLYVAGTTRELAEFIYLITGHSSIELGNVPNWLRHICMIVIDVIFIIPPVFLGEYVGSRKRQKDRKDLLSKNQEDK